MTKRQTKTQTQTRPSLQDRLGRADRMTALRALVEPDWEDHEFTFDSLYRYHAEANDAELLAAS